MDFPTTAGVAAATPVAGEAVTDSLAGVALTAFDGTGVVERFLVGAGAGFTLSAFSLTAGGACLPAFAFSTLGALTEAVCSDAAFAGDFVGAFGSLPGAGTFAADAFTLAVEAGARAEADGARRDVVAALAGAFSLVVALVLVAAFAAAFAATFVRVAADEDLLEDDAVVADAVVDDFAADFGTPMDGAVFALPPGAAELFDATAPFPRTDFGADFFPEPREGAGAATTPGPFVFSFFLADGIRGILLWRPAVETGRITQTTRYIARTTTADQEASGFS
ncbi:hypothetical protein [Methylocystis sp. ATCC 49242]|uniref:hypothetical protein n=1 Tax=Methylocystis sp. ATCC 49242 TaxID=622637 RepID=UPI001185A1FD|nr:hypothetical protein [Methylocystis sp. ATCC 49242]